jgi:hypothetical protein
MQQTAGQRSGLTPAVGGLVLVIVGIVALLGRELRIDVFEAIGTWGWPFFVIVPGLVLLGAALVPAPPKGLGFAIAGSVVTAIGCLLLYQSRADHWESWAYAWAVIPMAGGIGTVLYGALTRTPGVIGGGLWMAGISAIMLLVGAWFFEGIFAGEVRFIEIANWWPVAAIVVGAAITLVAILRPRPRGDASQPSESLTVSGPQER